MARRPAPSLALLPLIPLALGRLGAQPGRRSARLYLEGLRHVEQGRVLFNEPGLDEAFHRAMLNGT